MDAHDSFLWKLSQNSSIGNVTLDLFCVWKVWILNQLGVPSSLSLLFGFSCSRVCEWFSVFGFLRFRWDGQKIKDTKSESPPEIGFKGMEGEKKESEKTPRRNSIKICLICMEQLTTAFVLGKVRTKTSNRRRVNALESARVLALLSLIWITHSLTYNTHLFTDSC